MICKNCNQEMPEVGSFCPFCAAPKEAPVEDEILQAETEQTEAAEVAEENAEEVTEELDEIAEDEEVDEDDEDGEEEEDADEEAEEEDQTPKRKLKLWQIITIIAGGLVLLTVLVGSVLYAMGVDLKPRPNDLYKKDSYTAADWWIETNANRVVATVGDKELTVGELQLYYTNNLYTFLNQYYSYLAYFGLDITLPLDEQYYPISEPQQTWQQNFLESSLSNWQSFVLLQIMAEQEGYVISESLQAELDNIEAEIGSMAAAYGYASADEYLEDQMSPGVSMETYMAFNRLYYVANEYLDHCYEVLAPTDEEIEAYYLENEETFLGNGVEPDMGLQSSVRHILIQFEGGTTDENGAVTYTDEEKAVFYAEAEKILEEWKAGEATEESFAELANTYSADGGSNTTGGLYEDININASYVEPFRAWAIDATRKPGDTAIVETEFGYHIMYFVSGEDYFTYTVREQLISQRVQEKILAAREAYPMEVNYKKILLYAPDFA